MKKKKEIIIIISIVIISILLIFLPFIINNMNNNKEEDIKEVTEDNILKSITITVYGEITYQPINSINDDDITNEISFETKPGITYGEILNYIENFLTKYSIIDNDLSKRYFESSKILIKSSDETIEIINIDDNKININKASFNELTTITGIGTKRANKILDYIKNNGNIESFNVLKTILGVSDEIIENIKTEAIL